MKVLIFSTGADTGGQGYRIRQAFARHDPTIEVDALALSRKYMAYPEQFSGPAYSRTVHLKGLYDAADVVHLRLTLAAWEKMDRGQGKPVILHHHGTIFRIGHVALAERARRIGAVQIASTIDLTMLEPGVTWVPSPFDLAALRAIRERVYQPSDRIRIAHAPTNRSAKHTRTFEMAVRSLAKRYPVDLDIIENVSWAQCLERKAAADIFYDQLSLGYGNNAVEAWGMGIPVVSGVANPAVKDRMIETWDGLPFMEATPESLETSIRVLIESPDLRAEFAERGNAHAARFHDEASVVATLRGLYESAPATAWAPQPRPTSGRERREMVMA